MKGSDEDHTGIVPFEGGPCAPRTPATTFSQATHPVKKGYRENRHSGAMSMHGNLASEDVPGKGQPEQERVIPVESHGYACKSCGFTAKSKHGFARHVHSQHGYGGLGRTLMDK